MSDQEFKLFYERHLILINQLLKSFWNDLCFSCQRFKKLKRYIPQPENFDLVWLSFVFVYFFFFFKHTLQCWFTMQNNIHPLFFWWNKNLVGYTFTSEDTIKSFTYRLKTFSVGSFLLKQSHLIIFPLNIIYVWIYKYIFPYPTHCSIHLYTHPTRKT